MGDDGGFAAMKTLPIKAATQEELRGCVDEVGMLSDLRDEHIVAYLGSAVVGRQGDDWGDFGGLLEAAGRELGGVREVLN